MLWKAHCVRNDFGDVPMKHFKYTYTPDEKIPWVVMDVAQQTNDKDCAIHMLGNMYHFAESCYTTDWYNDSTVCFIFVVQQCVFCFKIPTTQADASWWIQPDQVADFRFKIVEMMTKKCVESNCQMYFDERIAAEKKRREEQAIRLDSPDRSVARPRRRKKKKFCAVCQDYWCIC